MPRSAKAQRKLLAFAGPVVRGYGRSATIYFHELHSKLNDAIPNTQDLIAAATFALNNTTALLWFDAQGSLVKVLENPEMSKALYASLDWDAALPIVDPFPPAECSGVQCTTRGLRRGVRTTRRLVLERLVELVKPYGGVDYLVIALVSFHKYQWQWLEMVAVRPQIQRFLEQHGLHEKKTADQ